MVQQNYVNKLNYYSIMTKHYIFYGTLKSNHGNNYILQNDGVEFLGKVVTQPHYTLFDGGFPIVERGGKTSIKGELYKVSNEKVIQRLNNLEGYSGTPGNPSNWYDVDTIKLDNGVEAEMYVMDFGKSSRTKVVESGIWN